MGRFERKIKKQMNKDTEDFDKWYAKNQEQLYAFSKENEPIGHLTGNGVIAISKRVLYPVIACVGCIVICLTVLLAVFLTNDKNDFDLTFGEDDVYVSQISDEEFQDVLNRYPFISKMQVTAYDDLRLWQDNSLVFTIIDGELETEDDYYFIKVQVEHNKNYEFGYKIAYQNLKYIETINGWDIGYEQKSIDTSNLYVFYLHLEDCNGQVIYMEVHCFENDISYILNEFI